MADKPRCEECDRTFKDEDGLEQHNASKHNSNSGEKEGSGGKGFKFSKGKVIGVIVLLVIVAFGYWAIASAVSGVNSCKTQPVTEMNIGSHSNLAMHIHPHLTIIIDGQQQVIPSNIGVAPGLMRPLHTHDASGELHVEGPCARDFILGEFFQIWGREFSSQGIFDKSVESGTLTVTVNGVVNENYENLILRDLDRIIIEYKSF